MTVAHDAASNPGSTVLGSTSWTHTPVGTPAAILVCVTITAASTDDTTGVTYGGVAMASVGSRIHTAGADDSAISWWLLAAGVPAGAQTVATTLSSGASNYPVCVSVTAAGTVSVQQTAGNDSGSGTTSSLTVSYPATPATGFGYTSYHSGENDPASISVSALIGVADFGNQSMKISSFAGTGGTVNDGATLSADTIQGFGVMLQETVAPVPATPSGTGIKVGLGLDSGIGWEIDGKPVRMLGDWQAEVATGWGERTFTGTVSKDVTWVDQGSTITGWRGTGEPLWQGTVVAEPRVDGERLQIRGEGYARKLAENRTRMFYRIDGFAGWSDKEEDPYNGTNNDKYDLTVRPGLLRIRLDPSDAFSTNDQGGFATWVEGGEITKYSFVVTTGASYGAFDLEYQRFTGPQGSKSTVNTHTLNPVSSPITGTMTNLEDAAVLRIIANTNAASGTRRVVTISSGKLYGRTNNDDFSLSDVCVDVGGESGFGTAGVESNALAILPLDWTEPHPGLLDYMTELADWLWMIRGDQLIVKPYGQIWETATDVGAKPQLEPEPQANRFVQPYRTVTGTHRTVTASAQTDPFPDEEVTVWGEELEDPQPNSDLAEAVAQAAVDFESTFRASGTVELTEVRYLGAVHLPYDVEAGDQLQLTDLAPKLGPQRVEAITYRPGNHATATVGQTFDLVRTLAENERPARRRRRKRRKGKP